MLLRPNQVSGHVIDLLKTDPRHMDSALKKAPAAKGPEGSFGDVMIKAFENVSDLQNQTETLSQKMITDPDEVNVHDVMISMAESNLAISMAKAVVDRAIRAYREIIGTR
jgi:flagellar hook-basal body complex protein FliE